MTDDERLTHYDDTKHVRYRTEFGANWICRDCEDINKPEIFDAQPVPSQPAV